MVSPHKTTLCTVWASPTERLWSYDEEEGKLAKYFLNIDQKYLKTGGEKPQYFNQWKKESIGKNFPIKS